MKSKLSLLTIVLILMTLACNSLVKVPGAGPDTLSIQTFSINRAIPADTTLTSAEFVMPYSTAMLSLGGGADRPTIGEIQYNIAAWEPSLTVNDGMLRIEQQSAAGTINFKPDDAINNWNVSLGDGLTSVRVDFPAGDLTVNLADSLPDGTNLTIEKGAGSLH